MAIVYFPSCKFKAGYPETSKKLAEYINNRYGMIITGCCRGNLELLTEKDIAVCVCNTCSAFCDESSKAREVVSIWEILVKDEQFPFPDYKGEEITLQDCWRAYDKRSEQDAIHGLMRKMNIRVIELAENYEKTRFCGTSVLQIPPAYYGEFAPKRFGKDVPNDFFQPYTDEDKIERMRSHCADITTERVACYCVACANGINLGDKQSVHVMELLFSTTK
ncbi:MAG TPA: hypothetical protein PKA10_17260 [Selenomonadales bacterium]|nr:hypothetical protein [Selenomonadales bacterium]